MSCFFTCHEVDPNFANVTSKATDSVFNASVFSEDLF